MRIALERSPLPPSLPKLDKDPTTGVGSTFGESLSHIDEVTKSADEASEGLVTGEVDLHDAMIAMEKANLVLKMGTTVRNKLLDAYRQLSQVGG